jgi:DNA-binding LacI/PurR family transcriptional regulator
MAKASVYDVAALAGVSIATVSRTINQPHRVSEITRSRVMEAVNKLDYVPDFEAAARARHHNDRIAVICPLTEHSSFIQRLRGISLAVADSQSELILFQMDAKKLSNPQNSKLIDTMASSGRYDGIIVISLPIENQDLTRIVDTHFPFVLFEVQDPRFPSIVLDNDAGAIIAVNHLIERGYKNIGFVGYDPIASYSIDASKARQKGYVESMLRNGRVVNPENILITQYDIETARTAAREFLTKNSHPDAVFCAADVVALGVLKAAQDLKLRVPEDIAIVGFDNIEMAAYVEMTTVRQPLEGAGKEAVRLTIQLIKEPTSSMPPNYSVPFELIHRTTS